MNTALTALLLGLLVVLVGMVGIFLLAVRKTWRNVVAFITPAAENQESPLAVVLDAVSHRMGQAMAMEIKTTFMGKESGLKRGEQAVAGDVAMDILGGEQPLIAGLLEGFPTLKKRLLKSPGLIGAALSLLGGSGIAGGRPPTGTPGTATPVGGGNNQGVFSI